MLLCNSLGILNTPFTVFITPSYGCKGNIFNHAKVHDHLLRLI